MNHTFIIPTTGFFTTHEHYSYLHAIMFLCVNPSVDVFRFAEKLESFSYKVFIVIDDNSYIIPPYDKKVTVIRYPSGVAESAGYTGCVRQVHGASSRCKALYYLAEINTIPYDAIWMIEEDVFIPSLRTLSYLDKIYPSSESDLMSSLHMINTDESNREWHWHLLRNKIKLPWAGSMICAIRFSLRMVAEIKTYVHAHHTLLMDELMFNTLALHAGLKVITPPELAGIVWKHNWDRSNIDNEFKLYHPIKNYQDQLDLKRYFNYEHFSNV